MNKIYGIILINHRLSSSYAYSHYIRRADILVPDFGLEAGGTTQSFILRYNVSCRFLYYFVVTAPYGCRGGDILLIYLQRNGCMRRPPLDHQGATMTIRERRTRANWCATNA